MGCVADVLAWVVWVTHLRGQRDSVGGVGGVLTSVACCYYYCYTILKKKMFSCLPFKKKSNTYEEGGAHLRISFQHLWMNLENK